MAHIKKLKLQQFPPQLFEIPQPPEALFVEGDLPPLDHLYLAVVGSRKYTPYGKEMCERLIRGLRGYPIVIVSGLAIGIDSIAHQAALDAGLLTMAFPGSGLSRSVLYPQSNKKLADTIIAKGGCLVSEYESDFKSTPYSFPQRNRLMAGICKAVLIIEAQIKSGTLVTARLALDYDRDILVVPGSALSPNSKGTNHLLRQGAFPITSSEELIEALGFRLEHEYQTDEIRYADCSSEEKKLLALLVEPMERDEIIRESGMSIQDANMLLSMMEIKQLITEEYGLLKRR